MNCPRCKTELEKVLTRKGVLVDVCPNGHGVWLDGGEIFFFVENARTLEKLIGKGLEGRIAPGIKCLRCADAVMDNGRLVAKGPVLDMCPKCRGMWFDRDELRALNAALGTNIDPYRDIMVDRAEGRRKTGAQAHRSAAAGRQSAVTAAAAMAARKLLLPLPNLALSSVFVLGSLYAMLFAILVAVTLYLRVSIHFAVVMALVVIFFQYLISPFIMDLMLRWLQSLEWVDRDRLPAHLSRFIADVTQRYGMPFPRVGIINDGTPNAFTYGHTPRNARVVVTRGLLEILNEDEVEAVVAHELGHAKHWDILIMTLAGVVPVILYYIYRILIRTSSGRGGGNRKGGGQLAIIALGAFILYIISQYIVLYLSRVREYYADRFGGEATGAPDTLATALVKVAYGLAGKEPEGKKGDKDSRRPALESMKAFGIFDPTAARGLAASSLQGSTLNIENAEHAMQWDLWNPWALYYELNSTHPLPAKRINALGKQTAAYGQTPTIQFRMKRPESFWDEFFVDLAVMFAPIIGAALGGLVAAAAAPVMVPGLALLGLGIGYALNLAFSYRANNFLPLNVASMLKKVKVSAVRPVPVKIKGSIIGRGVPGLIYSEDIVLRDDTGYIFLDYRQPLRIIEFLFGLMRTGRFIGREVEVTGWYRRAPVPYIEIRNLTMGGEKHTCYVYYLKIVVAALLILGGLFLMFGGAAL